MDSVGVFENKILEKPRSKEEAFSRLRMLSADIHHFLTGITLIDGTSKKHPTISRVVHTEVRMRRLTDEDISGYLEQDPDYNTFAIGYDPLHHYSATFVRSIEGSYHNLLFGCPLEEIVEMLAEYDYRMKQPYIQ